MYRIQLERHEIEDIQVLVGQLARDYQSVEDPNFLMEATTYAHELPRTLRSKINEFRMTEPDHGICVISGYPIDDDKIGDTPAHWKVKQTPSPALEEEMFFFLCASLLGDSIGWATQQDGYILHEILPIKGHELEQLGSSSEALLTWHTEDAFHPYRTDYLGLMCMRNPDNVETTYASVQDIEIDDELKQLLMQPRYVIRPDESHLEKNRAEGRDLGVPEELLRRSYDRINRMNESPEKVAVLFGAPDTPYMRVDTYFMDRIEDDPEATEALERFEKIIDEKIGGVALQPGDIIFLDNYKVVHGRKPFRAYYNGKDRWLKRLNITRDLRKSRDARVKPENRIIF